MISSYISISLFVARFELFEYSTADFEISLLESDISPPPFEIFFFDDTEEGLSTDS